MGYRGKVAAQQEARGLRAQGWSQADIATELGVSKSSVSLWVRDIEFTPQPRRKARRRGPNALQRRKAAEIAELKAWGHARLGTLTDHAFLTAGAALYAGEGSKNEGKVVFANSDPLMVAFFCRWLRRFFDIDESRLTMRIYLHEGLDMDAAQSYWSQIAEVPLSQFRKSYRAIADPTIRTAKHQHGCAYVSYSSTRIHRTIMGLVAALLSSQGPSGVAQPAEHATVNRVVESSSLSPGA
jgi:predicted transcriptional regulator